jgi:hypothetical protein
VPFFGLLVSLHVFLTRIPNGHLGDQEHRKLSSGVSDRARRDNGGLLGVSAVLR